VRTTTREADPTEACPACGARTLTRRGSGEVCSVCGWRDDPEGRADPDLASELNGGVSLRLARVNVERFGLAFPPSEVGV
jgi:hypothetical protein